MKKAIYFWLILSMFGLIAVGESNAGWPFNRTPAIEGIVTDATTGEPIENVVVSCVWLKGTPSPGGDVTTGFAGEVSVTGKDGRYKIPGKISFHLLSHFSNMMLQVCHPLYEGDYTAWDKRGFEHLKKGDTTYKWAGSVYPVYGEYRDGVIHYDIGMMGVRERYLKEVTSHKSQVTSEEEKKKIFEMGSSFWSYLSAVDNGWYWLTLKEKNIPFDLEETFKVWDKIGERYSPYYGDFSEKLGRTKEQIRGKVRNE